jgi:hypothetical protein
MALSTINIGSSPNDGTGDSVRVAFNKANQNFTYLQESITDLVANSIVSVSAVTLEGGGLLTGTFKLRATELDNYYDIATTNSLFTGGPVSGITTFTSTTESSNPTSGAVVVAGGLGVGGKVYGTSIYAQTINITSNIAATTANVHSANVVTGNIAATGTLTVGNLAVNTSGFVRYPVYTKAALLLTTGQTGWVAAISDSTPAGKLAYWDNTNSRWAYASDDAAVS